MAVCKKCKNKYYSKECPHCKKIEWKNKINKNNKIKYKTNDIKRKNQKKDNVYVKNDNYIIKTGVMIITICVALFTSYYFFEKYQENKIVSQYLKIMYGTDDLEEIEKYNNQIIKKYNTQNKALMKEIDKSLNQVNTSFEQTLQHMKNKNP